MKLSFVVPAHNEEWYVAACLASILSECRAASCATEIIVVDNASTDRTAAIARRFPGVQVVREPKKGITRARQAGLVAARGELVANIDADALLPEGWLRRVLREFEGEPDLVCLSGPAVYHDLTKSVQAVTRLYYGVGFMIARLNQFLGVGALVQGGNFVAKRAALTAIGGFNTAIDFYGEDTDLARRLVKVGKIKFTFALPIYASGRRLKKEGVVKTGARYVTNYFWVTLFGKPLTKTSTDIRVSQAPDARSGPPASA